MVRSKLLGSVAAVARFPSSVSKRSYTHSTGARINTPSTSHGGVLARAVARFGTDPTTASSCVTPHQGRITPHQRNSDPAAHRLRCSKCHSRRRRPLGGSVSRSTFVCGHLPRRQTTTRPEAEQGARSSRRSCSAVRSRRRASARPPSSSGTQRAQADAAAEDAGHALMPRHASAASRTGSRTSVHAAVSAFQQSCPNDSHNELTTVPYLVRLYIEHVLCSLPLVRVWYGSRSRTRVYTA